MNVARFVSMIVILSLTFGCQQQDRDSNKREQTVRPGLWVQQGEGGSPRVAFRRGDLYGFLDEEGRVAIEPTYRWAVDFKEGLALCSWERQGTFIDDEGTIVGRVPIDSETYFRAAPDRAWFRRNRKWGLCNLKGEVIIEPTYDDAESFSDGMARVNRGAELEFPGFMMGGKSGYVAADGNELIPCQFEELCWRFHDGYVVVGDRLLNRMGVVKFELPGLRYKFSEGVIAVEKDGKTQYVNASGEVQFTADGNGEEFSEGLAVVYIDGGFGYIDKNGDVVIEPKFRRAEPFSHGLAAVAVDDGQWGYINRKGELVTPTHFNELKPAQPTYAVAHYGGELADVEDAPLWWEGGRWLMIDRSGSTLAVIKEDRDEL